MVAFFGLWTIRMIRAHQCLCFFLSVHIHWTAAFLQALHGMAGSAKHKDCCSCLWPALFSHAEWAPASSSAAMTATSCKDPRASPASGWPTRWLRGATTGPSAEVSRRRQRPASDVGTLNLQTLYPKSHLNDIDWANRIWIMLRLPRRDFHYDTFAHIIININARGSQVRLCPAYLGFS